MKTSEYTEGNMDPECSGETRTPSAAESLAREHARKRSMMWGMVRALGNGVTCQCYHGSGYAIVQHCADGPWQVVYTLDAFPVARFIFPTATEARKATEELAR